MLLRNVIKSSISKIKPLKITGLTEGNGVHITSLTGSKDVMVENALETLLASLAACQLAALKAISKGSDLKIHNVKFVKIQSGLDLQKFMKGGPQSKLENVYLEAQVQSSGTQADLNTWVPKALNSCPVYQMLKAAGVKVESKWTNVKTLP